MNSRGPIRSAAVVGAIVLIGAMTLPGAPEAAPAAARTPWWCVACGSIGTADLIQNVALFLPFGFALASAGMRKGAAVALIVALTFGVELLQASVIVGRDASLGDVLANTAGGVLGWIAATRRRQLLTPGRRGALAAVVAIGAAFAIVATMATGLLQPALSLAEYTRARMAPTVAGRPRFGGEVLKFSVNGETYADRDVPRSLPRGDIEAEVTLTWPGRSKGTATIARIDGLSGDAVLSIDQRNTSIRVHAFSHASAWRLRTPMVDVPIPPGIVAGDTVAVRFNWQGTDVALVATSSRGASRTAGRYHPSDGWMLLNPFTGGLAFDRRRTIWTVIWVLTWSAAFGWYLWRALLSTSTALSEP